MDDSVFTDIAPDVFEDTWKILPVTSIVSIYLHDTTVFLFRAIRLTTAPVLRQHDTSCTYFISLVSVKCISTSNAISCGDGIAENVALLSKLS